MEALGKEKTVLIISALDCWSMGQGKGSPTLYKTLTGYAKRGWKVYFITGNKAIKGSNDIHENIKILRFDAPWLKRLMRIKKIGFLLKSCGGFTFRLWPSLRLRKLALLPGLMSFTDVRPMAYQLLKCSPSFGVCQWWLVF